MLPDFARVKARANRDLLRWARQQIPAVAPLMQGVAAFRQHEGKIGKIVREDWSGDPREVSGWSMLQLDRAAGFLALMV